MKKLLIVCSLVAALSCFMAVNAVAIPINGAISFSGTSVQDNVSLLVATAFTAFSEVVVSATGGTGDYAEVHADQPVTFTPFSFKLFSPITPLWTFGLAGKIYSFDATGLTVSPGTTQNTITMHGPGIAHITGFTDTPGNWYFSANGAGGTASFSASTDVAAVPEPGTMLLLGMGLVGIGTLGRRKLKK